MWKVFTIIWVFSRLAKSSYTTEVLQPQFEKLFADRCTAKKYPFLQQFFEVQNRPTDRYIYFVLHEHGLDTQGLGDRIAGLLTAASIGFASGNAIGIIFGVIFFVLLIAIIVYLLWAARHRR